MTVRTAGLVLIAALAVSVTASMASAQEASGEMLIPKLVVPLSGSKTTLRFIVKNDGADSVEIDPPFIGNMRLVVESPEGNRREVTNESDGTFAPVKIEPGLTTHWDVNIADHVEMDEPGAYLICFSVNGKESNRIIFVKD